MGNTVGSLDLPTKLQARKNLILEMTNFQKEVLIGCILGDAYITDLGKIRIEQGIKELDYANWKYETLKNLLYDTSPRILTRYHKENNKFYTSVRFSSRQYFRSWRKYWYPKGIKTFSQNLKLSAASLAVWYMDDGSWTGKKTLISIEGFDDESQRNIQDCLLKQFNIKTNIGKNRKLLIKKESENMFFQIIGQYVIPSMKYKIPNPVTTGSSLARTKDRFSQENL